MSWDAWPRLPTVLVLVPPPIGNKTMRGLETGLASPFKAANVKRKGKAKLPDVPFFALFTVPSVVAQRRRRTALR